MSRARIKAQKRGSSGGVCIELVGDRELQRQFARMDGAVQKKLARTGMRAAMRPVLADAKRNVAKDTHALAKSLKIKAGKRKRGRIRIEVTTGEGFFKGDQFYGGFIELGFRRGPRKLGDEREHVPGRPFMRPALQNNEAKCLAILAQSIRQGLRDGMR